MQFFLTPILLQCAVGQQRPPTNPVVTCTCMREVSDGSELCVVQVFEPQGGLFQESYNAYLSENEFRLNLQSDFSINSADSRVIISNLVTRGVEQVYTVP